MDIQRKFNIATLDMTIEIIEHLEKAGHVFVVLSENKSVLFSFSLEDLQSLASTIALTKEFDYFSITEIINTKN